MKLSEETMKIFDNFAAINTKFNFRAGKLQEVVSENCSFAALATTDEEFPKEIGLSGFEKLVTILRKMSAAELHFDNTAIRVVNGVSVATFASIPSDSIRKAPVKPIVYRNLQIQIKKGLMNDLREYARMMRIQRESKKNKSQKLVKSTDYNSLVIEADGKNFYVQVQERLNYANEFYRVKLSETKETFKLALHLDECKLIDDDYLLEIEEHSRICRFTAKNHPIYYLQGVTPL